MACDLPCEAQLVVLDVYQLTVLARVPCGAVPTAISQTRTWDPGSCGNPRVISTINSNNVLQYWRTAEGADSSGGLSLVHSLAVRVPHGTPKACDQADEQCRVVLVVYSSSWLLYLFSSDSPFCRVEAEGAFFTGGQVNTTDCSALSPFAIAIHRHPSLHDHTF